MTRFPYPLRKKDSFQYVDEGPWTKHPPIVLLHGMLGNLSNWTNTITLLSSHGYRVVVPVLPVYDLPLRETSVAGLAAYTHTFLQALDLGRSVLIGNSLGGHVALVYALEHPEAVEAMVLAGASGIYEVSIGTSTPRRYDPDYIRRKAALTFYDPRHATDELVAEMGEIVGNRARVLRLIRMARSTRHEVVTDLLGSIHIPTLLIWGEDDEITPPDVAEDFKNRLPQAELHFIPECGHAPMIEHPDTFNALTLDFLSRLFGEAAHAPVSTSNGLRTS